MYSLLILLSDATGKIKPPASKIIKSNANDSVANVVSVFVTTATIIAGLVFFVMLIIGGLRWLISGGDKAGLEAARNQIVNAAIGLIIVVGAIAVTVIVQTALGISILNVDFNKISGP